MFLLFIFSTSFGNAIPSFKTGMWKLLINIMEWGLGKGEMEEKKEEVNVGGFSKRQ